jgi:hypothetical protein
VYDVPRLVMVDSFWSSVLVGRSVATVAELCFAAQWALLLRATSRVGDSTPGAVAGRAVLPLIVLAEGFSWYAVLTTSNIGHVVEESLWGLCALLVVAGLVHAWPRLARTQRRWLAVWCVAAAAYAAYMIGVDVPMYWQRWLAQLHGGHVAMDAADGLADIASRWTVSHQWAHWHSEVLWMTAYFSLGVWASIALSLQPAWRRAAEPQATSAAPIDVRGSRPALRRTSSASAR